MKFHTFKLLAFTFLCIVVLAACSSEDQEQQQTMAEPPMPAASEQKEAPPAEPSPLEQALTEEAELMFYITSNGVSEEDFLDQYGSKIIENFPHYTVKYTEQESGANTLEGMIASNNKVDIMISSIGLTPAFLLKFNMQQDISDLITKYDYDLERLEPSTIEIQRQLANGGIYGLPFSTTSMALFYNKDLFDHFAVDYPRDGMTWDELYELARTMTRTEDGRNYRGLTFAFQHALFLNQYSAQHIDPETNKADFTSENFTKAFENMARFYRIPGNELPNHRFSLSNQQNPFYQDQTIAMLITLSGVGRNFADHVNWDVVQIPELPELPGVGPQSYPTYMYITNMTDHRDAAFQVLTYMTSDEFQEWNIRRGNPSILKDQSKIIAYFGADEGIYEGKNIDSLLPKRFAEPTMKTEFQPIADQEILAALGEYSAGKDLNTVLREAAERADAQILVELQ